MTKIKPDGFTEFANYINRKVNEVVPKRDRTEEITIRVSSHIDEFLRNVSTICGFDVYKDELLKPEQFEIIVHKSFKVKCEEENNSEKARKDNQLFVDVNIDGNWPEKVLINYDSDEVLYNSYKI